MYAVHMVVHYTLMLQCSMSEKACPFQCVTLHPAHLSCSRSQHECGEEGYAHVHAHSFEQGHTCPQLCTSALYAFVAKHCAFVTAEANVMQQNMWHVNTYVPVSTC